MTALNWEGLKRSSFRSDFSGDDLPRAGSLADQRRYGISTHRSANKFRAPSPVEIRSRSNDFQNLKVYALHAMHPDFGRKPNFMQREILEIINRLHIRCLNWTGAQSPSEIEIMKGAIALLDKWSLKSH